MRYWVVQNLLHPVDSLYPWLIVVLSLLGARLVSSATRRTRKIGFAVWMISNGMIGIGFYQTGDVPRLYCSWWDTNTTTSEDF